MSPQLSRALAALPSVVQSNHGHSVSSVDRCGIPGRGEFVRLAFEDAWHLRSDDYYSSRNYASRLIGTRLVLYTPLYLNWRNDPLEALPGLRRWRPGIERGAPFRPIAGPAQVYVAPDMGRNPEARIDALHSVTSCDLSADDLACSAVAVLGPESRTFYVSPSGVYLWIADWMTREPRRGESRAFLYRLPFGGAAPTALAAEGMPVDQFSFREDGNDGMINVLLRAEGGGDAMGGPEVTGGGIALLRVPIASLGDGSRAAPESAYTRLPSPGGEAWNFHNRFVGDWLLYAFVTPVVWLLARRFRMERGRLARSLAVHVPAALLVTLAWCAAGVCCAPGSCGGAYRSRSPPG